MRHSRQATPPVLPDDFRRVPGLLRAWEVPEVLDPGVDLHVEDAGTTADGTPVFAVYRRCSVRGGG